MSGEIPVVIVAADRHRVAVERLVEYCRELDGTEINVIEFGVELGDQYEMQHLAMRRACRLFYGTPFFWLEPDAIPRVANWRARLTVQYVERAKPFLLPSLLGLSRYDHAAAIGIYPKNAADIIPEKKPPFPLYAWDHWLYLKRPQLLALTLSIQHSYGVYSKKGVLERKHSFPLDQSLLRANAVIFHSDPGQTLISASSHKHAPPKAGVELVSPYSIAANAIHPRLVPPPTKIS